MDVKLQVTEPPRTFEVGRAEIIHLKDCAHITLAPNEQVTFHTDAGEYDVVRKSWGFYATPSLNGRLDRFGLRALLAKSPVGQYFILLVERGKEDELQRYLALENHRIVCWLDGTEALDRLDRQVSTPPA